MPVAGWRLRQQEHEREQREDGDAADGPGDRDRRDAAAGRRRRGDGGRGRRDGRELRRAARAVDARRVVGHAAVGADDRARRRHRLRGRPTGVTGSRRGRRRRRPRRRPRTRPGGTGGGPAARRRGCVEPSGCTASPLHSRNAPHVPQKVAPCSFVAPQTLQTITPPSPRVGQSGQSNRRRRCGRRPCAKPAPRTADAARPAFARVAAPRRLPRMSAVTSLSRTDPTVDPGGQSAITIKIRNAGSIVDRFDVDVVGPTTGWVRVDPPSLSLFPGVEGTVTITFAPPRASTPARRRLPVRDPRAAGGGPGRLDRRGGPDLGHAVHDRRGGHRPADVAWLARRPPPGRRRQPGQRAVRRRRHRPRTRTGASGSRSARRARWSRRTRRVEFAVRVEVDDPFPFGQDRPAPVPGQGRARAPAADRPPPAPSSSDRCCRAGSRRSRASSASSPCCRSAPSSPRPGRSPRRPPRPRSPLASASPSAAPTASPTPGAVGGAQRRERGAEPAAERGGVTERAPERTSRSRTWSSRTSPSRPTVRRRASRPLASTAVRVQHDSAGPVTLRHRPTCRRTPAR